ncbi:4-diphosphocytidyl-2-C-methyl-D-erythritol kinase [Pseudobutyrivibrio sp. 49]|uniref:4-(cytidine 5'-diphospho)-2-C-methyl-D-erythritol kinase n=1 Tax=unclassified Pseudobutyrivibrio TaxID=2638619 RepID=UPI000880DD3D|nr:MULTISPECIES: 4-(cytidine 5'-diphospho)-2-C-methyl-D-erythritol kinase [unclassified Pseudobutyrivibrio]SDI04404.1 4-diphosphocytidyl-2-C-methyl-D-erythritol kinase [Pseudobutyrivibrio sp. 49]SFO25338.1 4-diphosphocytidyl-2-C-methyl-D-erythritol kinase [Pseudobutyrivibrio sp. UC1225]
MDSIDVKALAKINIGLDVTGIRDDGYHEVRMIMQTVNLFDKLTVKKVKDGTVSMSTNLKFLPVNDDNLCIKAAKLLIDEFGIKEGVDISLEKHIPVAAGMAGGSTDGAAVLFAVNKLFDLGLSKKDLMDRGVKLGADVPYCVMRGTALAEGIGEVLSPLPPMIKCPVLIAKPGISVSTKQVYQDLDAKFDKVKHPDIDQLIEDIKAQDLKTLCSHMGNVLEEVTIPMYPIISDIKQNMMDHGAVGAMMSGSGPTVFGFFEDNKTAKAAKEALTESGMVKQLYLTTLFNNK